MGTMSRWILGAACVLIAAAASVPFGATAAEIHKVVTPDSITWRPGPPALPKGAMMAVLSGNPNEEGPFVLRLKFPANYSVPAHWHSKSENVTVLSGTLYSGVGDKLDRSKGEAVPQGAFYVRPAGMRHYVWTTGETVLQLFGIGPFDTTYVDSRDDPRQTTRSAR